MKTINLDSYLKSHFLNLYSIALSDLEVDSTELELLYKFGEMRGISKDQINEIIINADINKTKVPETLDEKVEFLYDFAVMIWADGKVDEFERNALKRFCKMFGFIDENISEITDFLLDEAKKGTTKTNLINLIKNNP